MTICELVEACRSPKHAEREVDESVGESIILSPLLCLGERLLVIHSLSPLLCLGERLHVQRKGRRECDGERVSARMKRRKEREERGDEVMWSGKLQR